MRAWTDLLATSISRCKRMTFDYSTVRYDICATLTTGGTWDKTIDSERDVN